MFNRVSLTVLFMVLGAQSIVVVVFYGQGMVLSFKMSRGEAFGSILLTATICKIEVSPTKYALT